MKKTTKILTAVTLTAALGGGAFLASVGYADHHDDGFDGGREIGLFAVGMSSLAAAEAYKSADTDGDGTLSSDEIRKLHGDLLAAHDANADGNLSLEEFKSLWSEVTRPVTVRAFQSLDTDGDAIVTRAEYDRLLADRRDSHNAASDDDDDDDGRWWNWN